jgi:hypothetical protein
MTPTPERWQLRPTVATATRRDPSADFWYEGEIIEMLDLSTLADCEVGAAR